jgi:putative spermidine/putrescine transport system ATP-binding protein
MAALAAPGSLVSQRLGQAISIRAVSKHYAEFRAVDALDLEIESGELVTLLGPSGSGKTTTLMMIAGFTDPSAGEILVGERRITGVPIHKRNIGVVFQHYALFPHMTVAENIAFPLKMRGRDRREQERRTRTALELVEMAHLSGRYPTELSGGQQQRVAFARAIVFDPPVLLLDEPLGALDKKLREALQMEIKALHARLGLTMVYVTHDQSEALAISDRVAVMNEGRLEQIGAPADLYEQPVSRFVADFIGEANFMPATVVARDAGMLTVAAADGARLRAATTAATAGAREVELMVRPEQLHIGIEAERMTNRIQGEVVDRSYVGDATKLQLRAGGLAVTARLPNQRGRRIDAAPGTLLTVGWAAEDTLVFPLEGKPGRGQPA